MVLFAHRFDWLGDGGIGIPCKVHALGAAVLQRFPQLLGAHDHFGAGGGQLNLTRISGYIMRFHTSIYYTHIFINVNNICLFFLRIFKKPQPFYYTTFPAHCKHFFAPSPTQITVYRSDDRNAKFKMQNA
jgi:hypothetical protein